MTIISILLLNKNCEIVQKWELNILKQNISVYFHIMSNIFAALLQTMLKVLDLCLPVYK